MCTEISVFLLGRYSITKAFCIAFLMTFFSAFDVPVFWPILLFYWLALFILTMRRQITHMIKYKYVPFSFGKQVYTQLSFFPNSDQCRLCAWHFNCYWWFSIILLLLIIKFILFYFGSGMMERKPHHLTVQAFLGIERFR